jgi:hypothetical protein
MAKKRTSAVALKAVPTRRTLVLIESGLLLGLAEGIMNEIIKSLTVSPYLKAAILMLCILCIFALAVRILEPLIRGTLKAVSKLDDGGGATMRIGLHTIILFLIFVGYVRVFYPGN